MVLVDTLHQSYNWVGEVGRTLHTNMTRQAQRAQDSISHAYQVVNQGYQQTSQSVSQKYHEVASKASTFVYDNKDKIFFAGCCLATAYFAPTLFFGSAVVTVILRVELSLYLEKLANEYLKDDHNPYKLNPRHGNCVSTLDLTMGSIAAVDAIALGTLFAAGSVIVALLPALGGIAAGSCAAKWAMDMVNA